MRALAPAEVQNPGQSTEPAMPARNFSLVDRLLMDVQNGLGTVFGSMPLTAISSTRSGWRCSAWVRFSDFRLPT